MKSEKRPPAKKAAPESAQVQDNTSLDVLANVSLTRQPLSFREWLISTPHPERIRHAGIRDYETDGINDLAYEVARDKEFPENGTLFDFVNYLQNLGARREVIETLHCAWWLYRRAGFGGK
jgi:hypothetical protein